MALPDAIYRNAIDLNRFGNKVSTDVSKRFVDICVQSVRQLADLDRRGLGDSYRAARLRSIVAQLEKSLSNWKKFANTNVVRELQGLAGVQAGFIEDQLTKVIPRGMRQNIQVNGIEISPKFAESVVSVDPTKIRSRAVGKQLAAFLGEPTLSDNLGSIMTLPNGNIVQQAFDKIADDSVQLFRRTVQDGLMTGETTPQITRRLLGNSKEGDTANILQMSQKGGIMTTPPINQIRTLVRTSINQVSNNAAISVYRANSDLTKKYRYTATLDSRTTAVCGALDGRVFEYEQGPMPPQHFNCRSTIVPEIDYDNLPFDRPPSGRQRASADGPVPEKMDYARWLYLQNDNVKARILGGGIVPGTTRYEGAFKYFDRLVQNTKDPRQALAKFVRADGSRVSLRELQKRYGKPESILEKGVVAPIKKAAPRKAAQEFYSPTSSPRTAISRGKDIVGKRLTPLDQYRDAYKTQLRRYDDLLAERVEVVKDFNKAVKKGDFTALSGINKREDKIKAAIVKAKENVIKTEKKGKLIMRELREEAMKISTVSKDKIRREIDNFRVIGIKEDDVLYGGVKRNIEEYGLMFNGAGITGGGKNKLGRAIPGVPQQINKVKVSTARAYNQPEGNFSMVNVNISGIDQFDGNYGKGTIFHEFAHSMEGMNEKNLSMAVAFRNNRVKDMKLVSPKKLKGTITGGYNQREKVLTDSFIHPYVGRPYRRQVTRFNETAAPTGFKLGDTYDEATEVISMGAEHFIDEAAMFRLYQADPDHFYMMMSLTRTKY